MNSARIYFFTTALLLIAACQLKAQDIIVRAGFLTDSVRVGDEIRFYLTAQYPVSEQVLFPDSIFNFAPFEFKKKKYFPTVSSKGSSYDSTVYYLTSFELDRIQQLELPIFKINESDCTRYISNRDTLIMQQLITSLPDSLTNDLPIRATIAYQSVPKQINFPLIGILLFLLGAITLVIWFAFGERIQKYYRVKRMKKAHANFISVYTRHLQQTSSDFSPDKAEAALSVWKKYMEQLNAKPYTKLTTRETLRLEKDEVLGRSLHSLDAAIYGSSTTVIDPLEQLKSFADQRFTKKLEEVKNG